MAGMYDFIACCGQMHKLPAATRAGKIVSLR